jgi:hypothetical protein
MAAFAVLLAVAPPLAAQLPSATPAVPGEEATETPELAPDEAGAPAADDPSVTAGGALKLFMASRDYRTLRQLKGVMTDSLQARFNHDSAPFNGKRTNRLVAFDFTEKDLKPRPAGGKPSGTAAPGYVASVRSLWAEQGEATEKRTESITLTQREDGLWRVANLALSSSEKLRFGESVDGVTVLRMVLRAWHRGEVAGARGNLSDAFLKKYAGRDEALAALFAPSGGRVHAAYQILGMTPQGMTGALVRVRFYETVIGEPGPIDGRLRTLRMIRKGSRWLVDGWE